MPSPAEILSAILERGHRHRSHPVAGDAGCHVRITELQQPRSEEDPCAGTSRGPESIVRTFVDVSHYWVPVVGEVLGGTLSEFPPRAGPRRSPRRGSP
jgi:hypothetical protein